MVEPKYQIKWTSQYKKDIKLEKKNDITKLKNYKKLSFRLQTVFRSMKNTATTRLKETGRTTVNVT